MYKSLSHLKDNRLRDILRICVIRHILSGSGIVDLKRSVVTPKRNEISINNIPAAPFPVCYPLLCRISILPARRCHFLPEPRLFEGCR